MGTRVEAEAGVGAGVEAGELGAGVGAGVEVGELGAGVGVAAGAKGAEEEGVEVGAKVEAGGGAAGGAGVEAVEGRGEGDIILTEGTQIATMIKTFAFNVGPPAV